MPEVSHLTGKHLFLIVGSNAWFAEILLCTLCFIYVGSWHIEIGYQTPLVRALYVTYA